MDKPAVCIATNRPESFEEWVKAWADEFTREDVALFVMADTEDVGMRRKLGAICVDRIPNVRVYTHEDVASDLGDKRWIIPSKTSACKSFAIYKAWKHGFDPIMVLDDDCLPDPLGMDLVTLHKRNLSQKVINQIYHPVANFVVRGTPRTGRNPVALSHGTWTENPDVDALTSIAFTELPEPKFNNASIPIGALFPMSGMNIAFRREIAPLMYFGLQGPTWGVDRFDDIWCGFLAKKVLDHCGYAVWSGSPYVRHVKASDPFINIVKEAPGYKMNVELYEWLMKYGPEIDCGPDWTPGEILHGIAENMQVWGNGSRDYWGNYGKAILEWLELFKPEKAFGI